MRMRGGNDVVDADADAYALLLPCLGSRPFTGHGLSSIGFMYTR